MLWAGRLAAQKRPELLAATARKLPELRFEVWTPQDFKEEAPKWGLDLPNVFGCGGYLNVDDLPLERYALVLFTSAFEGLPNLLLELGACAMPIVASAVGGIPELMQLSTGWAVDTSKGNIEEQADKLVAAIQQVLSNPETALSRGLALQKLIRKRHNPINYWQTGKKISSFFRK
ncbi:glycosyltransferase [Synechococcus lacustris Tous-12m]